MHEGVPHTSTTAVGYGMLNALGILADAFADAVPSKGDFEAAVARQGALKLGGKPLKAAIAALRGANPAAAKAVLRNLTRLIDATVTAARRAEKKKDKARAKALRARAHDLRTISLFAATRFRIRAVTHARAAGIKTAPPKVSEVAQLSKSEQSGKMTIGEEIPSGVPGAAPEISYLGIKADEMAGDDYSDVGAALAGYAGACGCGYGDVSTLSVDDSDINDPELNEDAALFLLLPKVEQAAVADAALVYPGAAKALSQGFLTRSARLAARAFTFLRKQRIAAADISWSAPQGSLQASSARRHLAAANNLIVYWAQRYYQRYLEDALAASGKLPNGTKTLQAQVTAPAAAKFALATQRAAAPNQAMQLAASSAAKNEAASAAAAVIKASSATMPSVAAAIRDTTAKKALAAALKDYREELTKEIFDEAAAYGRATARSLAVPAQHHRARLRDLLAKRRAVIVRELGLTAGQAKQLFALESRIMTVLADKAGNEYRVSVAKTPPVRAKLTAKITNNEKILAALREKRRLLLKFAKAGKPSGLAGLMVDVGDAVSDLGWAGFGLGAAGLVIGGALGSR
jgi:hypothetical protein